MKYKLKEASNTNIQLRISFEAYLESFEFAVSLTTPWVLLRLSIRAWRTVGLEFRRCLALNISLRFNYQPIDNNNYYLKLYSLRCFEIRNERVTTFYFKK